MVIIGILICCLIFPIGWFIADSCYDKEGLGLSLMGISTIAMIALIIFGWFHGFISYPPTEGTHQGTLTAVDMEGIFFRHYKVYLKSSAFTEQGDETEYCVYLYENELSEKLKDAIGKKVKLHYSHKGGYIGYNSCGTYHIDEIEVLENNGNESEEKEWILN